MSRLGSDDRVLYPYELYISLSKGWEAMCSSWLSVTLYSFLLPFPFNLKAAFQIGLSVQEWVV